MKAPLPGRVVRGSNTGKPVMAVLDLLGRHRALRIIWELRDGPLTFRVLQQQAATNPALLNTRLLELRTAKLVDHGEGGYYLTEICAQLLELLLPVNEWAEHWARNLKSERDC